MTRKFFIVILLCLVLFTYINGQATKAPKSKGAKSKAAGSSSSSSKSRSKTKEKSSSASRKSAIGFAAALVVPDQVPVQAPVGKFQVPKNNAPGLPFPDLAFKNRGDSSIIQGMTAVVNGQTVSNIVKNGIMGKNHPTIWDTTHCSQVPYFPRGSVKPDCSTQNGWFMDMSTGQCEQVTVTCDKLATLNFFSSESLCKKMCTKGGQPIKVIKTNVNLDPRQSCIKPPIIKMGSSTKMETVWTYDAKYMTCWKIRVPVDSATSVNVYHDSLAGAACQHMCHDIAPAGSGVGHSLGHDEEAMMMMMAPMMDTTSESEMHAMTDPEEESEDLVEETEEEEEEEAEEEVEEEETEEEAAAPPIMTQPVIAMP